MLAWHADCSQPWPGETATEQATLRTPPAGIFLRKEPYIAILALVGIGAHLVLRLASTPRRP
jgi:hypothetical protein